MARPKETNKRQLQSRKKNSLEQVLDWVRSNPGDAALMLAESVGMDPRPPWMREKRDVKELGSEAGLLAAGAVPIVGPLGRVGAKAGQAAKKASDASKVAQKAAGAAKPRPISNARAGGSSTGQAAGGSNRLTAREAATKRRGTKNARTEKGAKKVEAMEAKDAARTSINTGKASPVQIRQGSEGPKLPKGVTEKELKKFQSKRAKDLATKGNKQGRTKAEQERAANDIKERLEIADRLRAEGRRPGFDTPYRGGADDLPVGNPAAAAAATKATPRPSGTSARPSGKITPAAKKKATGKKAAGKTPAKEPGSSVVATGRGSTTREATGRGPVRPSSEVANRPGSQVVKGRVVRENSREPIDINARPVGSSGAGKGGGQVPRAAIGSGRTPAAAAGKGKMSKKKKALLAAGGVLAGGAALSQFDSDKSPSAKPVAAPASKSKAAAPKRPANLRDKYGRKISREEYNKRENYRKSLASMPEKERAAARKAEMERRKKYRDSEGASKYGAGASTMTRNRWMKEGVSSRAANRSIRGSATTEEARKKIQAIKRKKK